MSSIKVGICQMAVQDDKQDNLDRAEDMLRQAKQAGCSLAVLPEMFNCPYTAELFPQYAEEYSGETTKMLSAAASKYAMTVVGGSIPERDAAGRIYNTSFVFNSQGKLLARHRKAHLFDVDIAGGTVFQESKTLTAGDKTTVVSTPDLTFGVGVCYDIRFSQFARCMTLQGAKLLIYPAAFGWTTGPAHWELLLRSRAVDNQVFLIGAAPAKNPNAEYKAYGHSMLIDPWGRILAAADEHETVITAEMDLSLIDKVRAELPILKHWREDIYTS
ncbi:carbon-nitrogen hydrolase [Anaerosporomusa subterranea]|uniref:Carbon-nitrogen hydrolase n=1 Tax=Anaerosporomusa subterranea TaxID=1794912 RepID=A0A154BRT6_ANASB|nr:carbon-nitrogen hydrolase family protein [Anaerosporomusa subterranea]KYZ76607.1 carbon-nitrogen hydrolase [Anaerosporomusa subterranea]